MTIEVIRTKEEFQKLTEFRPELLEMMRRCIPNVIANELASVQPMPDDTFKRLHDAADPRTEEEMRADGYEPVDPLTKLLWVKKA